MPSSWRPDYLTDPVSSGGRIYNPTSSSSSATNDVSRSGDYRGQSLITKDQYAVIYDLLCEGEIEGLVNGPASIYLDDVPLMTGDAALEHGAVRTTGSMSSGSSVLTIASNALDFATDVVGRRVDVLGAGNGDTKTLTVAMSYAYGIYSVTCSAPALFSSSQEAEGLYSPHEQIVFPNAGPGGEDVTGTIIYVVSGTSAIVRADQLIKLGNYNVTSDSFILRSYVTAWNPSTNELTLNNSNGSGGALTDVNVNISSPVSQNITNVDRVWNFDGASASFRVGTPGQKIIPKIQGVTTSAAQVVDLGNFQMLQATTYGGSQSPKIYTAAALGVSNPEEIDRLKITFFFPAMFSLDPDDGDKFASWNEFKIIFHYQKQGESGLNTSHEMVGRTESEISGATNVPPKLVPTTLPKHDGYVVAQTEKPFLHEVILDIEQFQPFSDWQVEIRKVSTDDTNNDNLVYANGHEYNLYHESYLKSIECQVLDNLSYPNTAYSAVSFQAKDFSNPPTRAYHLRGKKIKVPTNYITREENDGLNAKYTRNVTTGADAGSEQDWDGNFRGDKSTFTSGVNFKEVYCNNPAWVFYDICTNPVYGLGPYIDPSLVNKFALYQIARYCDELVSDGEGGSEPRFTCNVYISTSTEAYKVLKDLATVFRGILYWLNGEIFPVQDRPKDPIYTFTQGNVIDGLFSYETIGESATINQVKVTWNDPDNNYTQAVEIVEDVEDILDSGKIRSTDVVAFGCTSRGQAHRAGLWHLYTNKVESSVVKFSTATSGAFLAPGDIINIQDHEKNDIEFSGRISNTGTVNLSSITVDRQITFVSGSTYYLHCFFPDGAAYLEQDAATINSVDYEKGNIVPLSAGSTPINSRDAAANAVDDSGNHVSLYWSENGHIETKDINNSPGTTDYITISGSFSEIPARESIWAISSDDAGSPGTEEAPVQYRILSVEENDDVYSIVASFYDPTKYKLIDFGYTVDIPIVADPSLNYDENVPPVTDLSIEYTRSKNIVDLDEENPPTSDVTYNATISWKAPEILAPKNSVLSANGESVLNSSLSRFSHVISISDATDFSTEGGLALIVNGSIQNAKFGELVQYSGRTTAGSPDDLTKVYRGRNGTRAKNWEAGTTIYDLDTVGIAYPHVSAYRIKVIGSDYLESFRVNANQTSISIKGLPAGYYSVSVQAENTRGLLSKPTRVLRPLQLLSPVFALSRIARVPSGGRLYNQISYDSSAGTITQEDAEDVRYLAPNGQEYTISSDSINEDYSSLSDGESAYFYFDSSEQATSNAFRTMVFQKDTGWASSDESAASSPITYGTFNWLKELGASTFGLTLCTGTIYCSKGSTAVFGTGTSFLTDYKVGDLIRLDSTNSLASLTSTAWYGEVSYVSSDELLYVASTLTKEFTASPDCYAFKQTFKPDWNKDAILARVDKSTSPSTYYAFIWFAIYEFSATGVQATGQSVSLTADRYYAPYDSVGNYISLSPESITLTATPYGSYQGSPIYYRFLKNGVEEQYWSTSDTFVITAANQPAAGTVDQWIVEATGDQTSPYQLEAIDSVSITALQEGSGNITGYLTSASDYFPADSTGALTESPPFGASQGQLRVFKGLEEITLDGSPSISFSVVGADSKNGLQISIDSEGVYSLTELSGGWTSDVETFTLQAQYAEGSPDLFINTVYTAAKAKEGAIGTPGIGFALLTNVNPDNSANTGEASLVPLDSAGIPDVSDTTDGFIIWEGTKIFIPRAESGVTATIATSIQNQRGFICFDTQQRGPFNIVSGNSTSDVAFVWKDNGGSWRYDRNNGTSSTFTPDIDYVAVGWLKTDSGSPEASIEGGGVFAPASLTVASAPGATLGATIGSPGGYNDIYDQNGNVLTNADLLNSAQQWGEIQGIEFRTLGGQNVNQWDVGLNSSRIRVHKEGSPSTANTCGIHVRFDSVDRAWIYLANTTTTSTPNPSVKFELEVIGTTVSSFTAANLETGETPASKGGAIDFSSDSADRGSNYWGTNGLLIDDGVDFWELTSATTYDAGYLTLDLTNKDIEEIEFRLRIIEFYAPSGSESLLSLGDTVAVQDLANQVPLSMYFSPRDSRYIDAYLLQNQPSQRNILKDPDFSIAYKFNSLDSESYGPYWLYILGNTDLEISLSGEGGEPALHMTPPASDQGLIVPAAEAIPLKNGDAFWIRMRYASGINATGSDFLVRLQWYDTSGSFLGYADAIRASGGTGDIANLTENSGSPLEWFWLTGKVTVNDPLAVSGRVYIRGGSNSWTTGDMYISQIEAYRTEPDATIGGTLGENINDTDGSLLDENLIKNDRVYNAELSGSLITNSSFNQVRQDSDGNFRPVGWYGRVSSGLIGTDIYYVGSGYSEVRLDPATTYLLSSAFKLNPYTTYEVLVRMKTVGGPFNIGIYMFETDVGSAIETSGYKALLNGVGGVVDPEVYDSANVDAIEIDSPSVSTSYGTYSGTYTPSNTLMDYASLGIIVGAGETAEVDWVIVREKNTSNTIDLQADYFTGNNSGSGYKTFPSDTWDYDQWVLRSNGSTPVTLITSTYFRLDEPGTYLITGGMGISAVNSGDNFNVLVYLQFASDGSSYSEVVRTNIAAYDNGAAVRSGSFAGIVSVTNSNTARVRVRLDWVEGEGVSSTRARTDRLAQITILRLTQIPDVNG